MRKQLRLLLFICLALPSLVHADPVFHRGAASNGSVHFAEDGFMHQATLGGLIMGPLIDQSALLIQGFWFPALIPTTSVEEPAGAPFEFRMDQNAPNPFNPHTMITFVVPGGVGSSAHASLTIFDIQGRCVRTLVNGSLSAGPHGFIWDGKNMDGVPLASGVYYAYCTVGTMTARKQLVLLK